MREVEKPEIDPNQVSLEKLMARALELHGSKEFYIEQNLDVEEQHPYTAMNAALDAIDEFVEEADLNPQDIAIGVLQQIKHPLPRPEEMPTLFQNDYSDWNEFWEYFARDVMVIEFEKTHPELSKIDNQRIEEYY